MEYALIHFYLEGEIYDIVKLKTIERHETMPNPFMATSEEYICLWSDNKNYPVKVMAISESEAKLKLQINGSDTEEESTDAPTPKRKRKVPQRLMMAKQQEEPKKSKSIDINAKKRTRQKSDKELVQQIQKNSSQVLQSGSKSKSDEYEKYKAENNRLQRELARKDGILIAELKEVVADLKKICDTLQGAQKPQKTQKTQETHRKRMRLDTEDDTVKTKEATPAEIEFRIPENFEELCNAKTVGRYTAELMSATLTLPYMACHTLRGQIGAKGKMGTIGNKPAICPIYLQKLIDHVMTLPTFEKDIRRHSPIEICRAVAKRLGRASEYAKQKSLLDMKAADVTSEPELPSLEQD